MRTNLTILSLAFFCALFVACQKSGVNPSASPKTTDKIDTVSTTPLVVIDPALLGTWQMVSDSTSSYSQTPGSAHGHTYVGTVGDHYTFTSNGTAYINENAANDTGTYIVNPDHSLQISYVSRIIDGLKIGGSANYFEITSLDTHYAVLSDEGWSPAGVYFVRIVTLKK